MIALPTAEETARPQEGQPGLNLSEQLVGFANETFAFSDAWRTRETTQTRNDSKRRATPLAYFADVTPPPLHPLHLKNARIAQSREQILPLLTKGGVCVEIGCGSGEFSRQILSALEPAKLHLCDRDFTTFDEAPFADAVTQGTVELHPGEPAEYLAGQPDRHFDFICIQAGTSYMATAHALEQAGRKIKDSGFILCANYTAYAPPRRRQVRCHARGQ